MPLFYRLIGKHALPQQTSPTVMTFDSLAVLYLAQNPESALGQGMKSTAQLMLAESMWNPIDKLSQFQAWQPQLEEAIAAQPSDPDLRFFRLSVQYSVPALLQYDAGHGERCREWSGKHMPARTLVQSTGARIVCDSTS